MRKAAVEGWPTLSEARPREAPSAIEVRGALAAMLAANPAVHG